MINFMNNQDLLQKKTNIYEYLIKEPDSLISEKEKRTLFTLQQEKSKSEKLKLKKETINTHRKSG